MHSDLDELGCSVQWEEGEEQNSFLRSCMAYLKQKARLRRAVLLMPQKEKAGYVPARRVGTAFIYRLVFQITRSALPHLAR